MLAWVLAGCTGYGVVRNKPITQLAPDAGYSLQALSAKQRRQSDELSLVVAFSGGGTRAAALAYGVLLELRDTRVVIDGQDVSKVTQTSLRRAIAVVPQDPALFHRSLFENIAYAKPDATREEVEAAAKKARAHDFILRLPQGYDTLVGERGVKLSGGERQRVAIARALMNQPQLLLADEPTGNLDEKTGGEILDLIAQQHQRGLTIVMVTHDESIARRADRIVRLHDGSVEAAN